MNMKNLFLVCGLSIVFYSCTKDESMIVENVTLDTELENVISEYELSLKDEQTPSAEKETWASEEERAAIQDSIRALDNAYYTGKVKTYATLTNERTPKVGVFKVSTCGSYGEFIYFMDCEDGGWSTTKGNVGATYAEGNKNIEFHFCKVPAAEYNGGSLLLSVYNWLPQYGNVDVVERYHDNEDSKNKNKVIKGADFFDLTFPGHCSFSENTTFTWLFSERKTGTLPFQYGVLTNSFTTEDGTIEIDDQNQGNSNSAKLWRHVASNASTTERYLNNGERFRGISHSENTRYYIEIHNN